MKLLLLVAVTPTTEPLPTASAEQGDAARAGLVIVAILAVLLPVLVGLGVKMFDFGGRREARAQFLEARLAEALAGDSRLAPFPMLLTAHVSSWRGRPVTLEVFGQLPTDALRAVALTRICTEAARLRVRLSIEDRVTVLEAARPAA